MSRKIIKKGRAETAAPDFRNTERLTGEHKQEHSVTLAQMVTNRFKHLFARTRSRKLQAFILK